MRTRRVAAALAAVVLLTAVSAGQRPEHVHAAPTSDANTWQTAIVPLPTRGIAYDAKRDKLLAAVASDYATLGNHLVEINPHSGALARRVFVGSSPTQVAVSADQSRAYVALSGATSIAEVDLRTFTLTRTIAISHSVVYGPRFAEDLAVHPVDPGTIAVALKKSGSPRHESVVIYDDGVPRPNATTGQGSVNTITWSDDPARLYGLNTESTGYQVWQLTVDAEGVSKELVTTMSLGNTLRWVDGLLHSSSGAIIDPQTFTVIANVAGGRFAIDPAQQKRFWIGNGDVRRYDIATGDLDWEVSVPNIGPGALIDAGSVLAARGTESILLMGDVVNSAGFVTPPSRPSIVSIADAPRIDLGVAGLAGAPDGSKVYVATIDHAYYYDDPLPPEAGRVSEVDPLTGVVTRTMLIGGRPYRLGVSGDGSRLVVGHYEVNMITEIDLATFTVDRTVTLPSDEYVNDLTVLPAAADSYAVVTFGDGAPPARRIAVIDGGTTLPDQIDDGEASDWIGFASATDELFGTDGGSTRDAVRYAITPTGVTLLDRRRELGWAPFELVDNRLVLTDGKVIDPVLGQQLGNFGERGQIAPARDHARHFIVDLVLREYDLDRYSGGFGFQGLGGVRANNAEVVGGHLVIGTRDELIIAPLEPDTRPIPSPPGPPHAQPGTEQVEISWDAPVDIDPSTFTHFEVTASPGGDTCASTTTSCTIVGLNNGTGYTFTVRSHAIVGSSDDSDPTPPAIPADPPSPPLAVTVSPGNGQATVGWDAPTDDGGAPIVSYTATATPGGASCTTAAQSCNLVGLTNGVPHTVAVTAHNGAHESPSSDSSDLFTPTACGIAGSGPFTDIDGLHVSCTFIEWLAATGVTTGFSDGTFRPNGQVTRGQIAAFLYRYADSPEFTAPTTASFTDVPTTHLFFTEIEWLAATGVTTGFSDGTFRPNGQVTRGQTAAFLHRYADSPEFTAPTTASFTDVPTTHLFFTEIEWLAATGVTTGFSDGTFRPNGQVTRGQIAAFLYRYTLS